MVCGYTGSFGREQSNHSERVGEALPEIQVMRKGTYMETISQRILDRGYLGSGIHSNYFACN